jgi:cell division protein ZapA
MNNEEVFKIQLNLLGKAYPYQCKRSEEGALRQAATAVTKKYMHYASHYAGGELEPQDILALTALHFAMETLNTDNKDTAILPQ